MNEIKIRKTFELLKEQNQLVEVRVITPRTNYSGYFKNIDNLVKQVKRFEEGNIYFVLNRIHEACYSREQSERFVEKAKNTTSDNDITTRDWLLIDIDPKRPSGVSSSDSEKETAKDVIRNIHSFLRDIGFTKPFVCDSGNGFHLLYRVELENTEENRVLCQAFLQVLDIYFSTPNADIDKTVFNAARITKLYGTDSKKGNNTEDRPFRESDILTIPDKIQITPIQLIQKVVDMLPKPAEKTYKNNYGQEQFSLQDFIRQYNIPVKSEQNFNGGTKYLLEHCLFDESHKGKDAAIIQLSNGAIAYKCFHNSCAHYSWQDVRKMYDTTAYDRPMYEPQRLVSKKQELKYIKPQDADSEKGSKFLKMSEIQNRDRSQIVSMPSKYKELDCKIIGFNKGEITLWSGKNGSAKSTIINHIAINHVQDGFRGIIYSGELPAYKMKNWIQLQAAGRQYTTQSDYNENIYFVKRSTGAKIDSWFADKLFIYNNDYGNNFEQLMSDIEEHVKLHNVDFVILDNLMALDLLTLQGDKYEQQKQFINMLCSIVRRLNIHIHIVAHPRKQVGFLRKDDISGTADLTNAVDNVIICHRNNNDYRKAIEQFFPAELIGGLTRFDNYMEVCKNRDLGVIDYFVGLYFEKESKRLLNELSENIVYDWQYLESQTTIDQPNTHHYETEHNNP